MPDTAEEPDGGSDLDVIADELYRVRPDEFVPERDEAVARARESGDRELARAIGKLRRPTRAAWLANLLARESPDRLEGLLGLAAGLADAQRTLDGSALRALSSQRHRLVAAVAAEAGRLAAARHESVGDALLREVQGILEAALADPVIADEVRSGRLTRTVSYSGFGPAAEPGAVPTPPRRPPPAPPADDQASDTDEPDEAATRQERERQARERARREEALAEAEAAEAAALDRQHADEAARDDAVQAREAAKGRVAELSAELETARAGERTATAAAREAEVTAKASARAAGLAATAAARARARLDELGAG